MHPYIPHLVDDINNGVRSDNDHSGSPAPFTFEDEMEAIERWVSGEDEQPFSYFCGLEKANFPPAEQLSEEDMKLVFDAFSQMLRTWNADISFPRQLPWPKRYELLVAILDHEFVPMDSGCTTFDFCTGHAPDCVFKEYCPCLEFWNEEKDDNLDIDLKEGELPF